MGAQGLSQRRMSPDLSVEPSDYFGQPVSELRNADSFGLEPEPEKDLYRVQYLYLLLFGTERGTTDYGGIQVRGSTHLYLEDGRVPVKFQRIMQRTAHRGAHLFDSGREEAIYGSGGGEWGNGYLSGFTPFENPADYRNWEVEPVGSEQGRPAGVQPGVLRWTTEVYLEVEGTQYADLSGVAQGIGDPYSVVDHDEPPREGIEAQQEWWEMTYNASRDDYDIHPPARTSSKDRAKNLHEKDVYLNGLKIGSVTTDGRVWLANEYADRYGDTYRGNWSREAVVGSTAATWQAIQDGRRIAKIDESPGAVYLATAQARPDDFDPVDPDEVDPDREVVPGAPGGTVYLLALPDEVDDPTRQECRQDQEIIDHLGYSDPRYSHAYADMWRWPGFRAIADHGVVRTPEDERDDEQTGLGTNGGEGS